MLSQSQNKYLSLAIEAALNSEMTSKHGAVINSNQPIIGNNMYRSRKLSYMNGSRPMCLSTHAEMDALHKWAFKRRQRVQRTFKGRSE